MKYKVLIIWNFNRLNLMLLMKRKLKLEKNNWYCKNFICKYRVKDLRLRVMVYFLKSLVCWRCVFVDVYLFLSVKYNLGFK